MVIKKVYVLYNSDGNFIVAASKTKAALKEKLCDMFMEDYRSDCQDAVDEHWIDPKNPSEDDRIFLKQTWDSILNYYNNYYLIEKVEMI